MGLIQHNAVLATTWSDEQTEKLLKWILTLSEEEQRFFVICPVTRVNSYHTILLMPDGSKEGWPESDCGDALRAEFIKQLNPYWHWIEVGYGEVGSVILFACDRTALETAK